MTMSTGPCPNCGHELADHAESGWGPNTVCVEKLDTFPHGGYYGVCPCVLSGLLDAYDAPLSDEGRAS
jgi:hypothetical protein